MSETIDHLLEMRLADFSEGSVVDKACLHAVRGGGRIRPRIVQMVANSLNSPRLCEPPALCIELLHCSSLIADDLPCMDDDRTRRGQPACHILFGEEVAILASYKLIAIAYHTLTESSQLVSLERHLLGLKIISSRSAHMINGQLSDLLLEKEKSAPKTTALFQAAFSLGWIYGGGDIDKLEKVERAAYLFGQAFQTADDLKDGDEKSTEIFAEYLTAAKKELETIGLLSSEIMGLLELLENDSYSTVATS